MVTGGHNVGRVGIVTQRDKHPGSFDIVHIKDNTGNSFATRFATTCAVCSLSVLEHQMGCGQITKY